MEHNLKALLKDKKVFIFDFDGTLYNAHQFMYQIFKSGLKNKDIDLTFEDFCDIKDKCETINDYINCINIKFNTNLTLTEAYLKYIELSSGLENLQTYYSYFDDIKNSFPQTRFIILSNQDDKVINKFLNSWKLDNKFEKVISCSKIGLDKDFIYKNFYELFNVKASDCVVFEDTQKHIDNTSMLGFKTVAIEHKFNKGKIKGDYNLNVDDYNEKCCNNLEF